MFQKVEIIGRLGRDAELRYTANGQAVSSFSVAVDDGFGDNKKTVWFKVSVWRDRAEKLNQYLTKGQVVFVEGRLQATDKGECRTWTDRGGAVHASFEISATEIKLLPGGPRHDDGEPVSESEPKQAEVPF